MEHQLPYQFFNSPLIGTTGPNHTSEEANIGLEVESVFNLEGGMQRNWRKMAG